MVLFHLLATSQFKANVKRAHLYYITLYSYLCYYIQACKKSVKHYTTTVWGNACCGFKNKSANRHKVASGCFKFICLCLSGGVLMINHAANGNLMTVAPSWMAWVPSSTVEFGYFYFLFLNFVNIKKKPISGVNWALSYYYFIIQMALEERYLWYVDFLNISFIKKKTYPSRINSPGIS